MYYWGGGVCVEDMNKILKVLVIVLYKEMILCLFMIIGIFDNIIFFFKDEMYIRMYKK